MINGFQRTPPPSRRCAPYDTRYDARAMRVVIVRTIVNVSSAKIGGNNVYRCIEISRRN